VRIAKVRFIIAKDGLTVGVTGAGAGVDSAWEQEKPEVRKMLVNRAESPASSARCVGFFVAYRLSSTRLAICFASRFSSFSIISCIYGTTISPK
jgi:hypothetical protein